MCKLCIAITLSQCLFIARNYVIMKMSQGALVKSQYKITFIIHSRLDNADLMHGILALCLLCSSLIFMEFLSVVMRGMNAAALHPPIIARRSPHINLQKISRFIFTLYLHQNIAHHLTIKTLHISLQ